MKRSFSVLLPFLLLPIPLVILFFTSAGAGRKPLPLKEARLIIEFNASAEDVGVQAFLDGDFWKTISIIRPDGTTILEVAGRNQLNQLGLTELFFESVEPALTDLPLEDFLALFPEGNYQFVGQTVDGRAMQGTATFTHNIPPQPVIVSPDEGDVVDPTDTVIDWDPVAAPGMEIVAYEVIVEADRLNHLDVHVPASVTQLSIPPEFLQPGTAYLFEVLAIEAGGNQTITEGEFKTAK